MQRTLILYICLLLAACASPNRTSPEEFSQRRLLAEELSAQQRYQEAAESWQRLAEDDGANAAYYRLLAADALLRIQRIKQAQSLLPTEIVGADADTRMLLRIVRAELAAVQGHIQAAIQHLPAADTVANLEQRLRVLRLQLQWLPQVGQHHNALLARIQLQELLHEPQQRRDNLQRIWDMLGALSVDTLYALRMDDDARLNGWYELAILYHNLMNHPYEVYANALRGWQTNHPSHPAVEAILPMLLSEIPSAMFSPRHIGLLLPFSGTHEKSAEAIYHGFLAAWYADASSRPRISVLDSATGDIAGMYRRALERGVDFIVGPLQKAVLREVLEQADPGPPILALNQLEAVVETRAEHAFQFALAPEHETEQLAERLWLDGYVSVLVLSSDNDWGNRMATNFRAHWQELGGLIVSEQRYSPGAADYTEVAKRLLDVQQSERRYRELQAYLGLKLHTVAQSRIDAQCIVLFASAKEGRLIVPQFRFFFADHLPVYASSAIYEGYPNPAMDMDLNSLHFPALPWIVETQQQLSPLYIQLDSIWDIQHSSLRRLYALGIDAYQIIGQLPLMLGQRGYRYSGRTGILGLDSRGRIRRRLSWARFEQGVPVPNE